MSRKTQIVELTIELIKTKSFLELSYDDLAKELGVTKAAIHYHFEKKADLGEAVCTELTAGLGRSYDYFIAHEKNPWAVIEHRISVISPDQICPITSLQGNFQELPKQMQVSVSELSQKELALFTQCLKEAEVEKQPEEVATLVMTSLKGILQYRRVLGEEFYRTSLRQLEQQLSRMIGG